MGRRRERDITFESAVKVAEQALVGEIIALQGDKHFESGDPRLGAAHSMVDGTNPGQIGALKRILREKKEKREEGKR